MDYADVRHTIEELLDQPTTMSNCQKLAALYTVLDHREGVVGNAGEKALDEYRAREAVKTVFTDDGFCAAIEGLSTAEVMEVIDAEMKIMQTTAPSTYDMVIAALKERGGR